MSQTACGLCTLLDRYATSTGEGAVVAIVDSGIEADHPALHGAVIGGMSLNAFGRERAYDGTDVAGHGTACAGRVLATAPSAKLISCRALDDQGRGSTVAVLGALDWILRRQDIHVVNLSLGGTPDPRLGMQLAERVDSLYARGIPVVVARGYEDRPDYPSAFGSPVSVQGERLATDDELLWHRGSVVEFGARGYRVEVPWRGGITVTESGSSFAAPAVAGRLARFKSLQPDLMVWDLKALLARQATVVPALSR